MADGELRALLCEGFLVDAIGESKVSEPILLLGQPTECHLDTITNSATVLKISLAVHLRIDGGTPSR